MKLYRYVDHQRLHIVTKDVISLSISVLLLFRHYISHKITFGAPSSGGVLRSACGAFIFIVKCIYIFCIVIKGNFWITITVKQVFTLNAPITTKIVCFSRLLKCLRSLYDKQCRPRSDCSLFASILK